VDKQAISDAVYGGGKIFADTPVWKGSAWGDAVDDSIRTYPLDPRATESLLSQAGVSKSSDGFYRGPDGRLAVEVATTDGPDFVRELLVLADRFGAAGLEIRQRVVPAAQIQDAQVRATFSGVFINSSSMGEPGLQSLATTQIGTAANRWLGGNRGAWSSPDFDRLLTTFNTTLDRGERVLLVRQMLRLYGEELPWISLFFTSLSTAFVGGLKGIAPVAPESTVAWNIHQWEFN
jgi:ABC-type transport system substrate-binding protein